jgi:Glycine/D-amino acid oxidases (deaminating)
MSGPQNRADVIVIGAGIVGTTIGLALARKGREVLLVDRSAPGLACSRGNAGIIATSEIEPLVSYRTLVRLPALLLDPLGPLRISPRALYRLVPWFWRALRSAAPARRKQAAMILAALCEPALDAHCRLLSTPERERLIRRNGMIDVIRKKGERPLIETRRRICQAHGIPVRTLNSSELAELEPGLRPGLAGGLFHPDVAHVADPLDLVATYADAFRQCGGRFQQGTAANLRATAEGAELSLDGHELGARHVVVAAGISSPSLLASYVKREIPLAAERGYHMQLAEPGPPLMRPIMFSGDSFVATPLARGVRLAGTAEFAAEGEDPDWRRAEALFRSACAYLPGVSRAGATLWMGARPTFPDSLPAIGTIGGTTIHYAFGHQHLGLTLSAVTAEMIAGMIEGCSRSPLLPYLSLERFA